MDLKGAEVRNILTLCMGMGTGAKDTTPLNVRIPYYQRPYRWGKEHIDNLINDFNNNFNKNKLDNTNAEYFVGSVVLVEKKEDSKILYYDVIDGQQRITTIFLLNYLRFIIQRSYIEEKIRLKEITRIDSLLDELVKMYKNLFGKIHLQEFEDMKEKINKKIAEINRIYSSFMNLKPEDIQKEQKKIEKEQTNLYNLYIKTVFLPDRNLESTSDYYEKYEETQKNFLAGEEIALKYARNTYNDNLIEALTKVNVIVSKECGLSFKLTSESENPNILQYTNALIYEFEDIKESICPDTGDNLAQAEGILKFIGTLIENVKFCVIMTGDENDAYTLFEVLNDRAMDIDDLDLIKNFFLKAYCVNSGDSENLIDKNVGKLDEIWGDIFDTILPKKKKLISFLSAVYLTANENISLKEVSRYRKTIEDDYLKYYFDNKDVTYSYNEAFNDITVYQMNRLIVDIYKLPFLKHAEACIAAEIKTDVSITYKAFHLLNALKYDGVMTALTNVIIKNYMENEHQSGNKQISIKDFKTYIEKIKDDKQHVNYKVIHDLAYKLWKAALLCEDYKIPREVARKVVQNASRKKWLPSEFCITSEMEQEMYIQFKHWLQEWKYNKSQNSDLKLKVLFINLYKTKKSNNELTIDKAIYTFTTEELHLDHMEADKPNESAKEKYFYPAKGREMREQYTNSLGNFMILDKEDNNDKNNKPLADALGYYDNMCHDHWLHKETQDLLNSYHVTKLIDQKPFNVPNEDFFNERTAKLMNYFEKFLKKDLYATKITL